MFANERPLTFSMELALQGDQTHSQRKMILQHLYQSGAVRQTPILKAVSSIPDTNHTENSASGALENVFPWMEPPSARTASLCLDETLHYPRRYPV